MNRSNRARLCLRAFVFLNFSPDSLAFYFREQSSIRNCIINHHILSLNEDIKFLDGHYRGHSEATPVGTLVTSALRGFQVTLYDIQPSEKGVPIPHMDGDSVKEIELYWEDTGRWFFRYKSKDEIHEIRCHARMMELENTDEERWDMCNTHLLDNLKLIISQAIQRAYLLDGLEEEIFKNRDHHWENNIQIEEMDEPEEYLRIRQQAQEDYEANYIPMPEPEVVEVEEVNEEENIIDMIEKFLEGG